MDNNVAENNFNLINEISSENVYINVLAKLYLKLKSKYFLTDSAVQCIIDGITDLNRLFYMHVKNNNTDPFLIAHDSMSGCLRTAYTRNKTYNKLLNIVTQKKIELGRNNEHIKCHYYYIPILDTLKVLLSDASFQYHLNLPLTRNNDIYRDITDGAVFKNNNFFKTNPDALRLILYADAFETCNPLGSAKKKHKLLAVYMMLGNVQPYARSKIDQFQLVLLCKEKHVSSFGINKIFELVIHDLKILETEGINFSSKCVKGTLLAFFGDNLGSHQIGGFNENFSLSQHFCRYCYSTMSELKGGDISVKELRNINNYKQDVLLYKEGINKGVKRDSCLNLLNFYHVTMPGLPPCIGHDLFEGIVQYDLALALNYLVKRKWFTYQYVNEKLRFIRFEHSNFGSGLPKMIKNQKKLPGNASQNYKFLLILPIILRKKIVDPEQSVWKMIMHLREICLLVMAFAITTGQIAILKNTIKEYLEIRQHTFADNLRPKHHYMVHYLYLISQFGPLKHVWTLRFEGKHRYFKNVLKHSQNYKNITYSLSEKHQLLQALYIKNGGLFNHKAKAENVVEYSAKNFSDEINSALTSLKEDFCFVCSQTEFKGIAYNSGQFLVLNRDEFGFLILLKIEHIFVTKEYENIAFSGSTGKLSLNIDFGFYEMLESCDKKNVYNMIIFSLLILY